MSMPSPSNNMRAITYSPIPVLAGPVQQARMPAGSARPSSPSPIMEQRTDIQLSEQDRTSRQLNRSLNEIADKLTEKEIEIARKLSVVFAPKQDQQTRPQTKENLRIPNKEELEELVRTGKATILEHISITGENRHLFGNLYH